MRRASFIVLFLLFVSVCSGDTFFVRSSGGSDANDGQEFSRAYATLQYAADVTSVTGSLVLVCGTFTPSVTVDFDTNAGGFSDSITWRGANASTGADDGTIAIISGSSLGANDILINITVTLLIFENLQITGATDHNIFQNAFGITTFRNCRIDSATDHGIYQNSSGAVAYIYDTEIDANAVGVGSISSSRGHVRIFRSPVHDNTGIGLDLFAITALPSIVEECPIYDNGSHGIQESAGLLTLSNNTIFGNGGDGLNIPAILTLGNVTVRNNIIQGNSGYGINTNSGSVLSFDSIERNCVYGNNGGGAGQDIDINGNVLPDTSVVGGTNLTVDAEFVSTTDGAEDFTPENPLLELDVALPLGAASSKIWVGAVQPPGAGGSASTGPLVGPGRLIR